MEKGYTFNIIPFFFVQYICLFLVSYLGSITTHSIGELSCIISLTWAPPSYEERQAIGKFKTNKLCPQRYTNLEPSAPQM